MLERFETERLILRVLNESDINGVLDYYIRNKKFLEPWIPKFGNEFFTYEFQLQRLNFENELWKKGLEYRFRVFKKTEPEKNIGNIAVSNIVRGVLQSGCLGYSIDENENGKGIATEAIEKVIEMSFNELKLHRLEANVIPTNTASIKVLRKLNFAEEGYSKNYCKINDK
ncbi:MAG: GNAT family N-acetyltransferase [Bacteroidota bacterium]|nr:GNAT family N-acetyltransferase [Bacteroidota bacterium]